MDLLFLVIISFFLLLVSAIKGYFVVEPLLASLGIFMIILLIQQKTFPNNFNHNGCNGKSKVFFSNLYFTFNRGSQGFMDNGGDSSISRILGT